MDQLKAKLEELNKEASKIPFLNTIAQKTKIPPAAFLGTILMTLIIILVLGIGSNFISRLIGVTYPAFMSIIALESSDREDDKQWLTYWVVYGCFICIDEFAGFILRYIPFYFFSKVCILIWLFNPTTKGALKVYQNLIKPLLQKYGSRIENATKLISQTIKDTKKDLS